jgi:hypothetical protein
MNLQERACMMTAASQGTVSGYSDQLKPIMAKSLQTLWFLPVFAASQLPDGSYTG